ncbi:MAG TPA: glycosyltransferase family 2 protein [Atribacterota bacterium]|nr:glycosyltransferase family 2 protein [Atribacterota bacterium]
MNPLENTTRATNAAITMETKTSTELDFENHLSLLSPDKRTSDRRISDRRRNQTSNIKKITVVIPALNEEQAIGPVIKEIPIGELKKMGYGVEIMVIDNGSKDKTRYIANNHGAKVIVQPIKGYGNAYKAGFANATGNIIVTGDADLTYPFNDLPKIIKKMEDENLDFITTDRLTNLQLGVMSRSHYYGNLLLQLMTKILFGLPCKDSQSGMWIFKRSIWSKLNIKSSGMPFSQELKIEVYKNGFKCAEVPIAYRTRVGEVKLSTLKDGIGNILHLVNKRIFG